MAPVPATVVQHAVIWVIHHLRLTIPMVQAHAINPAPRHVRDRTVRHLHTVAIMAMNQRVVQNITVVSAMHRLQHAR